MEKCVNLNSRGGFMKRNAILKLVQWKNSPERKPMVLRGARQVGKTWLMKEFGQNYYDNYVYFNCSTYPTTNCELWRIIGTFGDKIKIVRNESIGKYSWDNKDKTTGAETNYGKK